MSGGIDLSSAVCKHGVNLRSRCGLCFTEMGGQEGNDDADKVSHPPHYTSHPSGVECIQITEHMGFCLGNAIKYVWRAGLKTHDPIKDLRKAIWYIEREIKRLSK